MEKIRITKTATNTPALKSSQALDHNEAYLTISEEKFIQSKEMTSWDKKPFINDGWIFMDSDPDNIIEDFFENTPLKTISRKTITDLKYNRTIMDKLRQATPSLHSQDLGQGGTVDAKFRDNQSARQIFEDCSYSNGQIRIPQLTQTGACSIPSHLRIEQMSKFIGITIQQAKILAKIYRILDLQFNTVVTKKIGSGKIKKSLNNHIRSFVKRTGKAPWEIRLNNNGLTLLKLAQEIKALMIQEQEDPTWRHESTFEPGPGAEYMSFDQNGIEEYYNWYVEDQSSDTDDARRERNAWLSMAGEHYSVIREPMDKEAQFEQSNPVGEYTYWNNSVIPSPDHLKGHQARRFARLVNKMENFQLSDQQIIKAGQWVQKKCTLSQKAKWRELVHHVTGIRALAKMINVMTEQQDVRDQATRRIA